MSRRGGSDNEAAIAAAGHRHRLRGDVLLHRKGTVTGSEKRPTFKKRNGGGLVGVKNCSINSVKSN
jgi:hypothetical protein